MLTERLNTKELFTSLDDATSELVQLLSSFGEKQLNTIPFENSWTAAQVAEHVTKSNSGIVLSLQKEGHIIARNPEERAQELEETFLNFSTKLQSPKFILPTRDLYAKEAVIAELKNSIGKLKDLRATVNLAEAINHPVFGAITKLEMLHFVVYHTQRHIRQLKKIFQATETTAKMTLRHIISFMHISLDGFVAGTRGEMNWITMDEEIFKDAIGLEGAIDTALYGRTTYQMMESYWPSVLINPSATRDERYHAGWVEDIPKIVFSKTLEKTEWNNTTLIKENIAAEITKLKQEPGKNMMIFGSPRLTHSFMKLGLIDEYRININPVILGKGIPMFEDVPGKEQFKTFKNKSI